MAQERLGYQPSYREQIRGETGKQKIWTDNGGYLRYDPEGNLWINGLRVIDPIRMYGSPLEIVDTTIIEDRCRQWVEMSGRIAKEVGYDPEKLEYFYASKANMAAEVTHAAYRSGWMAETSGNEDLGNILRMSDFGLVDRRSFKIICNGFKLPPEVYNFGTQRGVETQSRVVFDQDRKAVAGETEATYADSVVKLRELGFDITPILDWEELEYFAQKGKGVPMEVGLRMKMGKVSNQSDLDRYVSRHGMAWEEVRRTADKLGGIDNLKLTTLHAMVGAAETMPVDSFVENLLFAVDRYFELKKEHDSLTTINTGGGVPPLSENYDHERFLRDLLGGIKDRATATGLPAPIIQFEFGSLVAAEAGFHVFKIVQTKQNNIGPDGNPETWAITDFGLMAAIPDMLIIDKDDFNFLAVNNANAEPRAVRIGDATCDSDGRWPTKAMEPRKVLIPNAAETYMLIRPVGAYQEMLSGVRGAHHCGVLEAVELILERRRDGLVYGRIMPRQTTEEHREILGYTEKTAKFLRQTLP